MQMFLNQDLGQMLPPQTGPPCPPSINKHPAHHQMPHHPALLFVFN